MQDAARAAPITAGALPEHGPAPAASNCNVQEIERTSPEVINNIADFVAEVAEFNHDSAAVVKEVADFFNNIAVGNAEVADFNHRIANVVIDIGSVTIEVGIVAIEPGIDTIEVRDFGIGLGPGESALVFNRFWRADPARARTSGGTGLGLSISLEDTHLHGGWLQAWGRPGEGAQFRLTLPRRVGAVLRQSPLPLVPTDVTEPVS